MTQEQREELDRLIDALKAGARLTASDVGQVLGSPFPIPLTMNIDYFLDIESENTKLKAKIAELTNDKN